VSAPNPKQYILVFFNNQCVNANISFPYGTLDTAVTSTTQWIATFAGCSLNKNPGIYRQTNHQTTKATTHAPTSTIPLSTYLYGIYDSFAPQDISSAGWYLMEADDYFKLTADLAHFLQANRNAIPVIKEWRQGSCCLFHGEGGNSAMGIKYPDIPFINVKYNGRCVTNEIVYESTGTLYSSSPITITEETIWTSDYFGCPIGHNPGLYRQFRKGVHTTVPTFRKFIEIEDKYTRSKEKCFPTSIGGMMQCNVTESSSGYINVNVIEKAKFGDTFFRIREVVYVRNGPHSEVDLSFTASKDEYGNLIGYGMFDSQQHQKSCNFFYTATYNITEIRL